MPAAILALGPHIVGPSGSVAHRIANRGAAVTLELGVGPVAGQQAENELFGFWREIFFRDQCDGLMAFATPWARKRRGQRCPKNYGCEAAKRNGKAGYPDQTYSSFHPGASMDALVKC